MVLNALLALLAVLRTVFVAWLFREAAARGEFAPSSESIGLGAITNFFDALGIGSFATTTAWIKFRKLVPDSFIPATLNVGHALPTITQAGVFFVLLGVCPSVLCFWSRALSPPRSAGSSARRSLCACRCVWCRALSASHC